MFQSTRPVRGATCITYTDAAKILFQSTRPVRGATGVVRGLLDVVMFQSTRPVRGATPILTDCYKRRYVSIHAPRAGRDQLG